MPPNPTYRGEYPLEFPSPFLFEPQFPDVIDCYDSLSLCDTINQEGVCGCVGRQDRTDMSIVVGLIGKDEIVLATDSRITSYTIGESGGQTHDDNYTKSWNIANKMGIGGISNMAGYESRLIELFQRKIRKSEKQVLEFDQLVERFTECARKDWTKVIKSVHPKFWALTQDSFHFLLAGYQDDIPKLKHISWNVKQQAIGVRNIERNYHIVGVVAIADYWIRKFKRHLPSMEIQKLKKLAIFLICESTYFGSIGGDIQMIVIQRDTGAQKLPKEELRQLEEETRKTPIGSLIGELKAGTQQ